MPPNAPSRSYRRWWLVGSMAVLLLATATVVTLVRSRANAWQRLPIVALEPVPEDRALVLRADDLPLHWHLALMNAEGEAVWLSVLGEGDMRARTEHPEGEPRLIIDAASGVGILGTSYAFSLDTGAVRWRYEGPPRSADPIVKAYFLHEGVLLALYPDEIVAVDVATGVERWRTVARGLRRFFRLPGHVLVQTDGANEATALDLLTGAKRTLAGPLCRFGSELLALRHDGSSVHDVDSLEPLRSTPVTLAGFAKPHCAAYRDMVVVMEASKLGTRLLALDSGSLEKRWEIELRPPPSTKLEVPMAERVAMLDPLPRFMPLRIGNTRQIVDLDTGLLAHELDLMSLPGTAYREGYVAANDLLLRDRWPANQPLQSGQHRRRSHRHHRAQRAADRHGRRVGLRRRTARAPARRYAGTDEGQ